MYDFDTLYSRSGTGSEKWDAAQAAGCPQNITPFTIADMEFKIAPEVAEAIGAAAHYGLLGYTFATGAFRQSVCAYFLRRHGVRFQPEWMVNTFGIIPAIFASVRAFTSPGDGVLIQPPVYPPFFSSVRENGRTVLENPLVLGKDGLYAIDYEDLAQKAKRARLMLFCNPQNPGGRTWPKQDVEKVAQICRDNGVVLYSDEIHCDILMPGHSHYSVGLLPNPLLQNCLIGTSTAKAFNLAGLPCSSTFVPSGALRQKLEAQKLADGYEFNTILGLAATKAAYDRGEAWLNALLSTLHGNYCTLKTELETYLPRVKVLPLQATYLAWLDFSSLGMGEAELTDFLRKDAQFYANPGEMFGTGGAGFVRFNFACPRSAVTAAIHRLRAACQKRGLV